MKCRMDYCINTEHVSVLSGLCRNCSGSRYYWNGKPPKYRAERQRKLKLYAARMATMFPDAEIESAEVVDIAAARHRLRPKGVPRKRAVKAR
jgi:hypothetical protein